MSRLGALARGLAVVGFAALLARGVYAGAWSAKVGWLAPTATLGLGVLLLTRLGAMRFGEHTAMGRPGARRDEEEAEGWRAEVELGALLLVTVYAALQATGGGRSPLHPLVYATVAFVGSFLRRGVALALLVFAALLEGALAFADAHAEGVAHIDWVRLAAALGFLALFALLHLAFLGGATARRRREHRARIAAEVERLRREAREFRIISTQLGAASRTRSRQQEEEIIASAAVENIHQALFYQLELLKKSIELHTCVLLWLDESGERFRIKELVSDSDALRARPIPVGEGLIGAVAKELHPVRLLDPRPEHLPYYDEAPRVGAFLGVPVIEAVDALADAPEGGEGPRYLRGVLCADRLRGEGDAPSEPFDERDEALLLGAAREILRAVRAERVFAAVERGKYEHERFFHASDLLNRALTPEQVYDTAFRAARELCGYDFAAIALFDRAARRHQLVAAVGEGAAALQDLSFAENAGLVSMAVKNKHPLPAGGERRDKDVPVYTRKARLHGMESLLVLPLVVADEAIGSFTIAAREPHRFRDKREMLGVIANQMAVSLKNAEMYRAMEQMATTDGLTGLVNHRTFQERFADLLARAERQQQPVSLLLTDVDHFKKVNDTYGHPTGDVVLKGVAACCRGQVRKIDVAARYGGEEFAIVLDGTDREGARQLAERIRREVAAQSYSSDKGPFQCTLSLGIATFPDDGRDAKTLIAHADQALYHAKHGGRNRSVAWTDVQQASTRTATG